MRICARLREVVHNFTMFPSVRFLPYSKVGPYATEGELCRLMFQSAMAYEQIIHTGMMCRGRKIVHFHDAGDMEADGAGSGPTTREATAADNSGETSPLRCSRHPVELLPSPLSPAALDRLLNIFELRRLEEALER